MAIQGNQNGPTEAGPLQEGDAVELRATIDHTITVDHDGAVAIRADVVAIPGDRRRAIVKRGGVVVIPGDRRRAVESRVGIVVVIPGDRRRAVVKREGNAVIPGDRRRAVGIRVGTAASSILDHGPGSLITLTRVAGALDLDLAIHGQTHIPRVLVRNIGRNRCWHRQQDGSDKRQKHHYAFGHRVSTHSQWPQWPHLCGLIVQGLPDSAK